MTDVGSVTMSAAAKSDDRQRLRCHFSRYVRFGSKQTQDGEAVGPSVFGRQANVCYWRLAICPPRRSPIVATLEEKNNSKATLAIAGSLYRIG